MTIREQIAVGLWTLFLLIMGLMTLVFANELLTG